MNVLNIQSIYNEEVIAAVSTMPPLLQNDESPTLEELEVALCQVKAGKTVGFCWVVWRFCFARQAACINEGCLEGW